MKTSVLIRREKSQLAAPTKVAPELISPLVFWGLAVALAGSIFALYSPTLDFQFILDDLPFVNDPRVQSSGHLWEYFSNYVWAQFTGGPSSFYRPMFVVWLRINFIFNEMSSSGWHLVSIVKHVAASVMLGWVVWKLLRDRGAVLIASALFVLHPSHTESVAWVTVPDPLVAAAILGSLALYLQYNSLFSAEVQSPEGRAERKAHRSGKASKTVKPSIWWLIASAIFCFAALLTKESAIVLPLIIFLLALQMFSGDARAGFASRPFFALRQSAPFLCATALYFLLRLHAFHGRLGAFTQHLMPWKTVFLSSPKVLWFYVSVLLWPAHSHAFGDSITVETFSLRGAGLPALAVFCAMALLAGSLFWAWRKTQRDLPHREAARVRCALLLGTLLLVLPILPALNLNALNPGDFMHGRYAYLSCTGLMLLLATGWHLMEKRRALLLLPLGVLAGVFGVLTFAQETAWKDNWTVFAVGHEIAPLNQHVALNFSRADVQVALRWADEGQCSKAIPVFEQAAKQFPEDWVAWAAMGNCFDQLNDLPKAEQYLRRASELAHQKPVTERWQDVHTRMEQQKDAPR
jgi:hypothetical protein